MSIDAILTQTFADNEHLAPDAADVLPIIRAELDGGRRQHVTRLAPILAAAVIIAVALTVVVARFSTGHSARPADNGLPTVTSDPEAAATAAAQAILRGIALPPGAHASDTEPAALRNGGFTVLSSLQAKASGVWLAPGTVPATVAFARAHPASGFTSNCTCGSPTLRFVNFFNLNESRGIDYVVAPYASGVAIRITVIVPWVPTRPRWTHVAATATSVDVTVQRVRQSGSVGGAPTVTRTLSIDATRRLAAIANSLRPEAPSNCSGPMIRIAATDTLVFHEQARTITFTMNATNCPQFSVEVTGQKRAYLEIGALDSALLRELDLPPDYGH